MTTASGNEAADTELRALYRQLLDGWNARDADAFAAPFTDAAEVIGFDGSEMVGRVEIATTLRGIFTDHLTGRYLGIVRRVTLLSPDAAVLRAVSGIVPAEQADLNPALNALHTLVATRHDGQWRIALYQNTPAQFHGRPEAVQHLTDELRQLL